nr:hypothetical protein [Micromonospora sp. DSM 115978]
VATDEAVATSGRFPTVAVFSAVERSPLAFLWGDPAWEFASVADVGRSDATVLASDEPYLDVLLSDGVFQPAQVDTSYTGDVSRFVAEDGAIVQVGFVTDEPYRLEHDIEQWAEPVEYLLLGDEYPGYANVLAVRQDKLEASSECLAAVVPLFQQAMVDYQADPSPTNDLMIEVTASFDTAGYELSTGLLDDANAKQRDLGLVADGPDGVLGSFDPTRVQELIDKLTPVLTDAGSPPLPGLTPGDVLTSEFIDPSISLK